MEKKNIYTIPSLYRDDFRIQGYQFGAGEKSLCVVGSVRGNEYQQIYTCSKLVKALKKLEAEGAFVEGKQVLVIPSLNPCSMNIGKRFWPTDNTDINRMFPGYALGETTQRIAEGVFKVASEYANGIQFASFYMPGHFAPHVRVMKTGYENIEKAREFGLPYIVQRIPKPYDTTTLNYNWQLWKTDAFSLYTTTTSQLDEKSADEMIEGVLQFMAVNGMLQIPIKKPGSSRVFQDKELLSVRPKKSGIFRSCVEVKETVQKGQKIALIVDTCEGDVLEELRAPIDGTIFFLHDEPLVYANTGAVKILPEGR